MKRLTARYGKGGMTMIALIDRDAVRAWTVAAYVVPACPWWEEPVPWC